MKNGRGNARPIEMVGAFESTFMPAHDIDVVETTRHDLHWRDDLALLRASGATRLRYPIRWHRIERTPAVFDWRSTDEVMEHMLDQGLRPIADLCHHTSYPKWIDHFGDPRFGGAYLRFVEAFAERYPEVPEYTLFNEPFTTFLLCGEAAVWPPHGRSLTEMLALARNVFPAVAEASRILGERLPNARHVYVEACEAHTAEPGGEAMAAMANDRRFFFTDLFVGRPIEPDRPFVSAVMQAGGADLLEMPPGRLDVLGLDYYAHNQWHWTGWHQGVRGSPVARPLSDLIQEYAGRYGVPCMLGETNIRGLPSDRATWLKFTLEQCERARDAGVELDGYCWFPFIDSCDWASLLARCDRSVDPVGVFSLGPDMERLPSAMSQSFATAASGLESSSLPAYHPSPPVARWASGFLRHAGQWDWEVAPQAAAVPRRPSVRVRHREERPMASSSDLVVFSHLRWTYVWQRPQHLISRLAAGRRTWFVEEPEVANVTRPRLRQVDDGPVTRLWLEVPGPERHIGFDDQHSRLYASQLPDLLGDVPRDVWLYTPLALSIASSLDAGLLVYDVMDDLASFKNAPRELKLRQMQALKAADVVFTGGRSLHRSVRHHRPDGTHLFPSGVEPEHYAAASALRRRRSRPVAGYVGVIDERLDLTLLGDLARALPDWDVDVVGPVAKIDPASLPEAANLRYHGPRPYAGLPDVMAGFDVALMPFARNEATRSISPTKTLEYLAAGLPVVSTPIPDVVADFGHLVDLQDDGAGFARACRRVIQHDPTERAHTAAPLLHWNHWDSIATRMEAILAEASLRAEHTPAVNLAVEESA